MPTASRCKSLGNHRLRRSITAQPAHPYVSRGGVKLAGALEHYPIDIEGHVCLDVGASTGGFTEVLLANGASLVFAIDVGRGQLHPSLHGHPRVVSMEETDIRDFEGRRLPARPDIVVIDVSFISLKAVLPVALSLAAAPMKSVGADQAAIRGTAKTFQARHHPQRDGASGNLRRHHRVRRLARMHRHPGVSVIDNRRRRQCRILHRRAPWLNISSSIMSVILAMASHLPTGKRFTCRTRCRAKRSRSRRSPAHPDRRRLLEVERASPERIAPFCPHFGVCGGCAIQHWDAPHYRDWKRDLVVETLAQAGIECGVGELIDAHGAGRRRITLHAPDGHA